MVYRVRRLRTTPQPMQATQAMKYPRGSPTSYVSLHASILIVDGLLNRGQGGVIIPAGNNDAHDAQQAEFASASAAAAAAEKTAGIDIAASIAAASSSAAAVAATATVNPLDPLPVQKTNLTPEQLGQLSGLRTKLAIDNQFGDNGAAIDDQESIDALISSGEGSF